MMNALLVGAATLALAGFGHAAVRPVQPALAPAPPASAVAQTALAQTALAQTAVAQTTVAALVRTPADATRQLGGPPRGETPGGAAMCFSTTKGEPFHLSLPRAVRCVLNAGSLADDPQERTAAPLPGALWLFGSALLVFLGISARRTF